jgi:hypothetical protein
MTAERAEVLRDFAENTAGMHMRVLRDDGLYRHLRFRRPEHGFNWFEIITWPHGLTFNGDHGCWSFSRIEDMFEFFTHGLGYEVKINPSYWAEKLLACDRSTGDATQFDAEYFQQCLVESIDGYDIEERPEGFKESLIEELDDVLSGLDSEDEVRRAADDFEYEGFTFSDIWEIDGQRYTFRYLYCLYATVWAIQQYKQLKNLERAA